MPPPPAGLPAIDDDAWQRLAALPAAEAERLACKANLGVWTERRLGMKMAPLHWEWCHLRMTASRLAIVAPRESSKTQTITVNGTAWDSIHKPGLWTYVFANSQDQARHLLHRIKDVVKDVAPQLVTPRPLVENAAEVVFRNGARVHVAGAGKSVRGAHPDVIIGDDVLEEDSCMSSLQRRRTASWWFGTVSGMSHPGTVRSVAGVRVRFPPTRVFLVGTPFHRSDLLMSMRDNSLYEYRRYAGEFHETDLVDGLAVEVA